MKQTILLFLLFSFNNTYSQFLNTANITFSENGSIIDNPLTGGLNSCQFSEIDINIDGIKDLFVFDRTGDRILPFICTMEGQVANYDYAPQYIKNFPELNSWALLIDYNCDNKADIFTYNQSFVRVYLNTSNNDSLSFEISTEAIVSDYTSIVSPIFISFVDIPSIIDVDNDGDLDILTFQQSGGNIEYHQNQSMETYGNCDSLTFELNTDCWGNFFEGLNSYDLNNCNNQTSAPSIENRTSSHSGSSLLALDIDGDNDKDILLGDVSFNNINLLTNGGTDQEADMTEANQQFPVGFGTNISGEINSFPAMYYIDINKDSKRDLIVSPNIANNSENFESIKLFTNTGEDNAPLFEFTQNNFLQDNTIDLGSGAYPCVIDYNNDGLKDLLVGNFGYFDSGDQLGQLALFKNIGTDQQAAFELIDRDFAGISDIALNTALNLTVSGLIPTVGDLDGDGDNDLIVGDANGKLHYFKNTATSGNDAQFQLETVNYFDIDVGQFGAPFLFDINQDNLLDLVIGKLNGTISVALNTGNSTSPIFNTLEDNLGNINVSNDQGTYGYSKPFVYKENDDIKMLVASESGYIYQYENINDLNESFTLTTTNFQNIKDGIKTSVVFEDFNGDNKRDLFLGNESGGLIYFENNDESNGSSIKSTDKIEFEFFPNPIQGLIYIKTSKETEIEIFSLIGQKVFEKKVTNSRSIDISSLTNGTYFLRIIQNKGTRTEKIIIQ
jgi:hypothetical protein